MERLAPSHLSAETEEALRRLASTKPNRARQKSELELVAAHLVFVVMLLVVWGLVGWLSESTRVSGVVYALGVGLLLGSLSGVALHLVRYYDALVSRLRGHDGRPLRWPRASGDLDLLIQLALAALVVGLTLR